MATDRGDCICPNDADYAIGCPAHASSRPTRPDPIEALAEGLVQAGLVIEAYPMGLADALAQALAATPSVAALLAEAEGYRSLLALAAKAVAEGCYLLVEYDGETWSTEAREVALDDLRRHGRARALPAAIAAALGEDGDG